MAQKAGRVGVRNDQVDVHGKLNMKLINEDDLPSFSAADNGKYLGVDAEGELAFSKVANELPAFSSSDNGKFLTVSSGNLSFANIPAELPAYSISEAGKVLAVDTDGSLIWKTLE